MTTCPEASTEATGRGRHTRQHRISLFRLFRPASNSHRLPSLQCPLHHPPGGHFQLVRLHPTQRAPGGGRGVRPANVIVHGPAPLRLRQRPEPPPPPPQLLLHPAEQHPPPPPQHLLLHAAELLLRVANVSLHPAELAGGVLVKG